MNAIADREQVLFANEAFYRAYGDRDIAALDALWARGEPVLCIHPGWPPILGRAAVMASWTRILANPQAPRVACVAPQAFVAGDQALVVCHEAVAGQALVATNLFRRESGAWRLFHHQAGPAPGLPAPDASAPPPRPH
ncbi:MAG: nuclear transport factor 2 family protein [bacterium]